MSIKSLIICDNPTCGCTCAGVITLKVHSIQLHYCSITCLVNGVRAIERDTKVNDD